MVFEEAEEILKTLSGIDINNTPPFLLFRENTHIPMHALFRQLFRAYRRAKLRRLPER